MTAQPHEAAHRPNAPERTLDAVSEVLLACGEPRVVARFQVAFAEAWRAARERNTLIPLVELVDYWWPEAALWTVDPVEARRAYREIARTEREGPSVYVRARLAEHPEGMTRERAIAQWEQANGRPMVD